MEAAVESRIAECWRCQTGSGTANDSRIVAEHNTFPRQSRGQVVGFCRNNPDELHVFWLELSKSAIDPLSCNIHFFVLQITGFIFSMFPAFGTEKCRVLPFIFNMFPGLGAFWERNRKSARLGGVFLVGESSAMDPSFRARQGGHSNRLGDRLT